MEDYVYIGMYSVRGDMKSQNLIFWFCQFSDSLSQDFLVIFVEFYGYKKFVFIW